MSLPKHRDTQDQETVNQHVYCLLEGLDLSEDGGGGGGENQTTSVWSEKTRRDEMTTDVNQQLS